MRRDWRGAICGLVTLLVVLAQATAALAEDLELSEPIRYQAPEFLDFNELKLLSENPYPLGATRRKLQELFTTPIINNEAYYRGTKPHKPSSPKLGEFIRLASWNIEQSINMNEAIDAFTDADIFTKYLDPRKTRPGLSGYQKTMKERKLLVEADIIVLQEMDIGVKRSGYRDAAKELAQALNMNYAYLVQQIEVDPVLLGTESISFKEGQEDAEATAYFAVDPKRYKGLFGLAVLSHYPVIKAEGFQLFSQAYDWYWNEKRKLSFLEHMRRFGAKKVFLESPHREIKVGGRAFFRVDLHVPDLPEQRVSIINIHLEIKATPHERSKQMNEILSYIKDIQHPVIMVGDYNSAPQDLSPTSTPRVIERRLAAPEFWLTRMVGYVTPYALLISVTRFVSNCTKNYQNPTAMHIPLLAPNAVGELFKMIERFRFGDGGAFDFRGTRKRSAARAGKLSNSNHRDWWAYRTTFKVDRTIGNMIGKYRLDWIFVKSYLKRPKDRRGSYRFAPHFGRTLTNVNKYLTERISDHDPIIVDLPLQEPFIDQDR